MSVSYTHLYFSVFPRIWGKGGKSVETANLLASSGSDVDFMIHGLFSYELFGQTFWITTTHVAIFIVMLIILAFAVAARIAIKHASEYPTGFQNCLLYTSRCV